MSKQVQLRLECDYCHIVIIVPPDKESPETANWVQVAFNKEMSEFCSPSHAAQWLKTRSTVIYLPTDPANPIVLPYPSPDVGEVVIPT
jgi:hypothetical protein